MKKVIAISLLVANAIYANSVDFNAEFRTRYEFVDTSDNVKNANALTARVKLGVTKNFTDNFKLYLEGTSVITLGDFWDLSNNHIGKKGVYNVVADPRQSRVTQAYFSYKFKNTEFILGRQGVNLDNQRFIGTVNWRQMPQTYDAFTIKGGIDNFSYLLSYVWQVNTIFDKASTKAVKDSYSTKTVLINTSYKFSPLLKVTAYSYLIKNKHNTYGIALSGSKKIDNIKFHYRAEYAKESNPTFENNGATANAHYYDLEAGLSVNNFLFGLKYELLSAGKGGNKAFETPLATLHAHNGWADMFLATPANGLKDMSVMVGYKSKKFGVTKLIFHKYKSDKNSIDYGKEFDIVYKKKLSKGLVGLIKGAYYKADSYKVDTKKLWVMVDYKF